jgi:hypothetical protein
LLIPHSYNAHTHHSYSKIELCELQRFLWSLYSSRLSDELFDHLTSHRALCDPADGALSQAGFLELSARILAHSRAARKGKGRRAEGWKGTVLRKLARGGGSKALEIRDWDTAGDVQMEVSTLTACCFLPA